MELLTIIRMITGSIFVLFLPGLAWSFVFFKKDEIDMIERIAISFGLSIALVPLVVFYINYLAGIKITIVNSVAIIVLLILIPVIWLKYKENRPQLFRAVDSNQGGNL